MIADFLDLSSHSESESDSEKSSSTSEQLRQLKRRDQTANARAQRWVNLASKAPDTAEPGKDHPDRFRERWYSGSGAATQKLQRENHGQWIHNRAVAICSYMQAFAASLKDFLSQTKRMQHVVTTNIVDDVELRAPMESKRRWTKKAVMNNIQNLYMRLTPLSGIAEPVHEFTRHVKVHQPFMVLEAATGPGIWSQFISWVLISMAGVGWIWQKLNITAEVFQRCIWIATTSTHDRLRANMAIPQTSRSLVFHKNRCRQPGDPRHIYLDVNCVIHSMGICRKVVALFNDGYWCHLVRLGHLFESAGFRAKWKEALCMVIMEDWNFRCTWPHALPDEVAMGKEQRYFRLQFKTQHGKTLQQSAQIGRTWQETQSVHRIIDTDTSDEGCSTFGQISDARAQTSKKALVEVSSAYLSRFGDGFPPPLLHRWKHGVRAQNFFKDCWHHLVQTLDLPGLVATWTHMFHQLL